MTLPVFLAETSPSLFWMGWENMEPMTKIVLVIVCFLLGLIIAFLYRGRWARRHLRLLREQDHLKRKWDTLNSSHSTSEQTNAGGAVVASAADTSVTSQLIQKKSSVTSSDGATVDPVPPVEPVIVVSPDQDSDQNTSDNEIQATPVVAEPVSISNIAASTAQVSTVPISSRAAPKIPTVDAPLPTLTQTLQSIAAEAPGNAERVITAPEIEFEKTALTGGETADNQLQIPSREPSEQSKPLIVNIPSDADPLHLLTGLNPAAANALITLGITRFEQIFAMEDKELEKLASQHSSLEPLRWHEVRDEIRIDARMRSNPVVPPTAASREKEKPKSQAPDQPSAPEGKMPESPSALATTIAPTPTKLASGENSPSPEKKKIARAREKNSDTRQKVEHIAQEAKHVVEGSVNQVKSSLDEAKNLATQSTKEGGSIAAKAGQAITGTAMQITDLIKAEFQGEDVVADLQLGVLYKKAPDNPDDLTLTKGIDVGAAKALNSAGIFTFRQLAHLNDTAPAALANRSPALANIDWKATRESANELHSHPVKEALSRAAESIKDIADEAKQSATRLADTVTDPTKRQAAVEKGKEELKDATERAKQVADKVSISAREAVEDLQERARQVREEWKAEAANVASPGQHTDTDTDTEGDAEPVKPPEEQKKKLSLATRARHLGDLVEARVYGDKAETDEHAGFRYQTSPFDADDLTKLPGLEVGHAGFLNALGVYKI
ncbi:MAG: putative flap endonuclease-1-like 5' DNA nuclease, partial [Verrucomicrobiales bacterium]